MPLFSGRLEGERGHSDRSIVSSLRRRHADSKSVMLVDTSFHRKKVSGVKRGMAGTRSCGGEKPDSGVATAPRRGCATMNNVASTRNAASKRKYDGAGGKVIRPVNILSMFPGCDGWCMEMRGCKRLENSFDAEVSQGECLERDSAMGNSSKRARLAGESPGDQKQEDLESDVRAGLPVCTTTQSSAAQKCKYTQARAEKLMRTLLGRFSNEALHRVEEFFGRVTGWDPGKEWPVTSKRRTKDWYRVQFERMLQSGKRLALVKRNRFNLELRGWPPKGGGQVGRADEKEQDFLATRISKQQSVSRNVVVSEAKKVCDTTRASDARGPPLAQDEKAASKVGITDQELGDVHPELRARLIAAEAWAATAEQRVSEVQQDSKVMQACLEGRVSWLEEEVVNIRAKLVAAAETKASLLAAVRKGKEESANAKALKQEAETRLSKLEQSVTNSEASRVKAENRWLQQEIKLTIAEEDRCSAETRVAELEHARLDLLQRLRRARGNCATANVGFATAQTRVATLTREVSELLRCLNAAREERKATSMRAAASEKRTVEAESRLAMLENNVWRYSEMLTDVLEDLWPGGQLMTPARHVAFIQELGTDPSRDRLQEEASFPLESGLMPGFETEGVEVVPSGAVVCAGPHSDTGDSVPRVVEQDATQTFARGLDGRERQMLLAYGATEDPEKRAEEAEGKAAAYAEALLRAEENVAELQWGRIRAGGELAELEKERTRAEEKVVEVEKGRRSAEKRVKEGERERDEAKERVAELEGQRTRAEESMAELERERTRTGEKMAEMEKGRTKAERKAAELEKKLKKQLESSNKSGVERKSGLRRTMKSGKRKQGASLSWRLSSDEWCFPEKRACTKQRAPLLKRRRNC